MVYRIFVCSSDCRLASFSIHWRQKVSMNKGNILFCAGIFGIVCFLAIAASGGSNEAINLFSAAQASGQKYEDRPVQYVLKKQPPTVWVPPIHLISAPYIRNDGKTCRLGSSGAEYCQ